MKLNKDAQALLSQAIAGHGQIEQQFKQSQAMVRQLMRSYGLDPDKSYKTSEDGEYTEIEAAPNG